MQHIEMALLCPVPFRCRKQIVVEMFRAVVPAGALPGGGAMLRAVEIDDGFSGRSGADPNAAASSLDSAAVFGRFSGRSGANPNAVASSVESVAVFRRFSGRSGANPNAASELAR